MLATFSVSDLLNITNFEYSCGFGPPEFALTQNIVQQGTMKTQQIKINNK